MGAFAIAGPAVEDHKAERDQILRPRKHGMLGGRNRQLMKSAGYRVSLA
jgi:hypothetical protein